MVKQMSQTNDMKKIIVALDYDDEAKVLALCNKLDPTSTFLLLNRLHKLLILINQSHFKYYIAC